MKTFFRFALCFVLLTISRATAQETFAPLITENCVAVVHVDFSKMDVDVVKGDLQKLGEALLKGLAFDDKSFKATARELTVELEKLDILVRSHYEKFTKELGITECALIADWELIASGVNPFVAVPWNNKTEKHFDTFIQALAGVGQWDASSINLENSNFVIVDGFLLLLPGQPYEKERVAAWSGAAKPAPASAPIHAALKSTSGAEIKAAVVLPENLREMIVNAPFPPDLPLEVRNFFLFAAQKIEWASASVLVANLFGKEPAKNADVLLTVKMAKPADAVMMREMLENLIEFGVHFTQYNMEQESRGELQMSPLTAQFLKGFLRTLLPDVEGDKLFFRIKGSYGGLWSGNTFFSTFGIGTAMLLPAFQTAQRSHQIQVGRHSARLYVLILTSAWSGPYVAETVSFIDPWGAPYQYVSPGKNGRAFEIWSFGPDGIAGTEDDIVHWINR